MAMRVGAWRCYTLKELGGVPRWHCRCGMGNEQHEELELAWEKYASKKAIDRKPTILERIFGRKLKAPGPPPPSKDAVDLGDAPFQPVNTLQPLVLVSSNSPSTSTPASDSSDWSSSGSSSFDYGGSSDSGGCDGGGGGCSD